MLRPSGGEKCRLVSRLPRRQTADARRRQVRRLQGGMYEARENVWKEVFLNPETRITTFSESRLGSRPGIPHNSSQFLGMIRIYPCCKSSAPAHCGNRGIDFMDVSRPRVTFPGLQVSPSGEVKGLRVTNRESRPFSRRRAKKKFVGSRSRSPRPSSFFTNHETRDTKHGFRRGARRKPAQVPRFSRNTSHESRNTAFTAFWY